jgi:hypothetical protein
MGQSQKKTITHSQWKNQPVAFVKVKVAGKPISLKATSAEKAPLKIVIDPNRPESKVKLN